MLFGNTNAASGKPAGSLFGGPPAGGQPAGASLFGGGAKPQAQGGLFGKPEGSGQFGNPGASAAGGDQKPNFGGLGAGQQSEAPKAGGGLFGAPASNVFGQSVSRILGIDSFRFQTQ